MIVATERDLMHRLIREGLPIAEVARRLGRSRQTIYNWLQAGEDGAEPKARRSKIDGFRGYIESRLAKYDVPATVLFRELRARGYDGGITILRDLVRRIKDCHVQRLVDRFETEPGLQAQVDWASCGTIVHRGRRRRLSLLTVVLGHSRVIWARFVVSERRPVLMELLERCFRDLGGVPRELVFDNLKQVVARARSQDAPAVLQPGFVHFAEHWAFEIVACPPYWPRAKGKVERAISYIKSSFLEGRSFVDLDDLNAQLEGWLATVANVRVHGTIKRRPVDLLEGDRDGMLPIAGRGAFPTAEKAQRLADHDGRISFRGVRYSVDPSIIGGRRGRPVEIRVGTDERLRLFADGRVIGEHEIAPPGSPPQDDPAHARARRQLRQRPPSGPPKSGEPRFEQEISDLPEWYLQAPVVAARDLGAYEVTP